jgi:CDP-diacylglycerol--serine O-phosphatidyltransferase
MAETQHPKRGIYVLPTLFTVGNLFCGFASLVQAATGHIELAALAILVGAVLDALDGRIARLTRSTSQFGIEFDSLADVVSFGLAPALLMYHWALHSMGRIGWLAAFLYVVCAAMRLARFNLKAAHIDKRYFAGLPSPAAGGVLASLGFAFPEFPVLPGLAPTVAVIVFVIAALMLSRVRYRSFKDVDLRNRRSYLWVLPIAAILVSIAVFPKAVLLVLTSIYVASGPGMYAWSLLTRGRTATPAAADEPPRAREVVDGRVVR